MLPSKSFCLIATSILHLVRNAAANCVTIQYDFPASVGAQESRAAAVVAEYQYVWGEYAKYAFGNDTLRPKTQTGINNLFGWGASIVDGIDTAIVMNLTDIVDAQLEWIAGVDFSTSIYIVDFFDAFIRYIGGLLSAHDLIYSNLVPNGTYNQQHVDSLLAAAVTISDKLKPAFNTQYGLPLANINFTSGAYSNCNPITPCNKTAVDTAQAGTMVLEWYRLSDLTGDSSYRQLAQTAENVLVSLSQMLVHPNLVGSSLNYLTGKYTNFAAGWQGGIDSFYEYLIKVFVYNPSEPSTSTYKDFWVGSVESTNTYLAKHPYGFPNLTFISQLNSSGYLEWTMDDYACFAGGNMLLGGKYLNNPLFMELGLNVTESCRQTYDTASGLNPSAISWFNAKNKTYVPAVENNTNKVDSYRQAGFFVDDPGWFGYPEPIESMYYAWRITGNPVWRDYAWEVFQAILNDTRRSPATFGDLSNVTEARGGKLKNMVPSYYFAEVLKYLYLIFSEPSLISLDEWVFNTECHPFKIQTGTCASEG